MAINFQIVLLLTILLLLLVQVVMERNCWVRQGTPGTKVFRVLLVPLVLKVTKKSKVLLVLPDLKEIRAFKVPLVLLVLKVIKVFKVLLVLQDLKVIKVFRVLQEVSQQIQMLLLIIYLFQVFPHLLDSNSNKSNIICE